MKVKRYFVINLDRRPDKLQTFYEKFPFDVERVERFAAIDGNNLPFDQVPLKGNVNDGDTFNPFMVGCSLSHYSVFDKVAKNDEYRDTDVFVTFEDDVFYSENFVNCMQMLEGFHEDFDMISIGGRWWPNFVPPLNDLHEYWTHCEGGVFKYKTPEKSIAGLAHDRGTFSLMWTKKFAKKFVAYLNSPILLLRPVDKLMTEFWSLDQSVIYDVFPHICYSPADFNTDIQHKPSMTFRA